MPVTLLKRDFNTGVLLWILRNFSEQLLSGENLLVSATVKKNFTVDAISGISVILRTCKAKGCNLKTCNLLERNSIAELFMKNFQKFSKHLSNIVWCFNLVELQPVDGGSATALKCKFFENSRVGELLLVTYQCKWPSLWQRCRMQTSLLLQTLYKNDSNPAILKIIGKTHKKHLRWRNFPIYFLRVDWKAPIH